MIHTDRLLPIIVAIALYYAIKFALSLAASGIEF